MPQGQPRRTHGKTGTAEWRIWCQMRRRCSSPRATEYKYYGGRGIAVCERWAKFENFLADMGPRPSPKHSLDRFPNNDGNYEPGNVRWATDKEQNRNSRNNNRLTWRGETLSLIEWSERTGLPVSALYKRVEMGWTSERTLTTAIRSESRKRGPYGAEHRAALSIGQKRRWATQRHGDIHKSNS